MQSFIRFLLVFVTVAGTLKAEESASSSSKQATILLAPSFNLSADKGLAERVGKSNLSDTDKSALLENVFSRTAQSPVIANVTASASGESKGSGFVAIAQGPELKSLIDAHAQGKAIENANELRRVVARRNGWYNARYTAVPISVTAGLSIFNLVYRGAKYSGDAQFLLKRSVSARFSVATLAGLGAGIVAYVFGQIPGYWYGVSRGQPEIRTP
ncbi:MAG: hypothetical protein HY401_03130 [Elusimicrobia bacterium]|nr:hypothetical protein [Elusimicrobiota bacterium]